MQATIHGVAKSQARLSDFTLTFMPLYKIQVNHFMALDDWPGAKIIPKYIFWVRGLVPFSEFLDIPFFH